jgi:hypothetical protein
MRFRALAVLSLVVLCSAAPARRKTIAPDTLPHSIAMFLSTLSSEGKQRVTFKAAAIGTHFFFEEQAGVTVYVFDGGGYRREAFLKGSTLGQAVRKYRRPATTKRAAPKTKR